jgi:peptide/nickel transport system permease protein
MSAYIIRRLLLLIPTLFLVTIIVFLMVRLIPGDVIDLIMEEHMFETKRGREVNIEAIEKRLGLDLPIHVQYGRWISDVFRGDLGESMWTDRPVTEELRSRLPVSLELGLLGIIVGLLIAVPVGIYSAIRQDTIGDYLGRSFAILCIAVPNFWVATMVIVFPSIWWQWTPSLEYIPLAENPIENFKQFIIPAAILGMVLSGYTMRMTRTMMLEVLRQDYIRTAWSKGLRERVVIIRHALKNALIPVVSIAALQIPVLIGGSVIIEQIFSLPGMGRYFLEAIADRDYTIVSGINLVVASVVLLNNLVTDMTYAYLDPRVQYR